MEKIKALVVGGSLGGLTTAIALDHAGLDVSLFEKKSQMPGTAGGLGVRTIQAGDSSTARFLKNIILDENESGLASYGHVAKKWEDLYETLLSYLLENTQVDLNFDTRVIDVSQNEDQIYVKTKDKTYQGHMLIGADGHRSLVRTKVDPDKPHSKFAGYLNWLGTVDEAKLDPKVYNNKYPIGYENVIPGPGKILIGFIMPGDDGSEEVGQRSILFGQYDALSNDIARRVGALKGDIAMHSVSGDSLLDSEIDKLIKRAKDYPWPQPFQDAMLYAFDNREFTGILLKEYVPDKLYNNRIAIVGDAAHVATSWTGMGYNASLQDAASLGENIINHQPDVGEVSKILELYERDRLEEVRRIVLSGHEFSKSFRVEEF